MWARRVEKEATPCEPTFTYFSHRTEECDARSESVRLLQAEPWWLRMYYLWRIERGIYIAAPGAASKVSMNLGLWMNPLVEFGKIVYTGRVSVARSSAT